MVRSALSQNVEMMIYAVYAFSYIESETFHIIGQN